MLHHITNSNGRRWIRVVTLTKSTRGRQDFVSLHYISMDSFEQKVLITKFTYETVWFCRHVADLAHFVRHVLVLFRGIVDQLKAIGVQDILVLSVIILLDGHRFVRLHWIEEIRERHQERFFIIYSLLRWQVRARSGVGYKFTQLRPALVKIHPRRSCYFPR